MLQRDIVSNTVRHKYTYIFVTLLQGSALVTFALKEFHTIDLLSIQIDKYETITTSKIQKL